MSKVQLLLVLCGLASVTAGALQASELDSVTATNGKVKNYCLGGGEDRKLIPYDGLIHNTLKQTTHFTCESEGGRPTYMPDLEPLIKDGKLA